MARRTVTVSGRGSVSVRPDVVQLELRVGADADDVGTAVLGSAGAVTELGRVVREHGVPDRDIRTVGAETHQRFDREGNASGFTAQQRLRVTLRDLELVGPVLGGATEALGNALLVDQVRLDVAERAEALRAARDGAFADALAKAEQYASLSGSQLGDVVEVVGGDSGAPPVPRRMHAAREMAMAMPVEAGELEVEASVTVTWRLR